MNEPGTGAYLGGLRLAQARDCKEFLEAALYWKTPTENLICGDVDGNISFQALGAHAESQGLDRAGCRCPGTGKYEWDGFRTDLPRLLNPPQGYIATANNNVNVPGYAPVMFKTLNNVLFERIKRVEHVLNSMLATQKVHDRGFQAAAARLPARCAARSSRICSRDGRRERPTSRRRAALIAAWDAMLRKESAAAAIYLTWRSGRRSEGARLSAAARRAAAAGRSRASSRRSRS